MFSSIAHKTKFWSFTRRNFCVVCALNCARISVVRALDCAQFLLHPALFLTWNTDFCHVLVTQSVLATRTRIKAESFSFTELVLGIEVFQHCVWWMTIAKKVKFVFKSSINDCNVCRSQTVIQLIKLFFVDTVKVRNTRHNARWHRGTSTNYDMYDSVLTIHSVTFTN